MKFSMGIFDKDEFVSTSFFIGDLTGSDATDFYVYEWFIKSTGEVFYVGKGRGNRYKAFHERAYEAEKIRKTHDTDIRFVDTNLTEEKALILETKEMLRILNNTTDRLTNRVIPFDAKRGNGYEISPKTPSLKFENAPYFYASEIQEHYFSMKPRPFDKVELSDLKNIVFIMESRKEINEVVYGGESEKYFTETKALLLGDSSKILKSQYAKSVTAWVYVGDDYLTNYEIDQKKLLERIGRQVPCYHLIDVWHFLKKAYGDAVVVSSEEVTINPLHNRVPLESIKNLKDSSKGYKEGYCYWDSGESERKAGNFEKAIELYDLARFNGYDAPVLYKSYMQVFKKVKDYDNEIAIIDEYMERLNLMGYKIDEGRLLELKQKKEIALKKKLKI